MIQIICSNCGSDPGSDPADYQKFKKIQTKSQRSSLTFYKSIENINQTINYTSSTLTIPLPQADMSTTSKLSKIIEQQLNIKQTTRDVKSAKKLRSLKRARVKGSHRMKANKLKRGKNYYPVKADTKTKSIKDKVKIIKSRHKSSSSGAQTNEPCDVVDSFDNQRNNLEESELIENETERIQPVKEVSKTRPRLPRRNEHLHSKHNQKSDSVYTRTPIRPTPRPEPVLVSPEERQLSIPITPHPVSFSSATTPNSHHFSVLTHPKFPQQFSGIRENTSGPIQTTQIINTRPMQNFRQQSQHFPPLMNQQAGINNKNNQIFPSIINRPMNIPNAPQPGRINRNLGLALFERPRNPKNRFPKENSINRFPVSSFPNFPSNLKQIPPTGQEFPPANIQTSNNQQFPRKEQNLDTLPPPPPKQPFFPNDQRTILNAEQLSPQPIGRPLKRPIMTNNREIEEDKHLEDIDMQRGNPRPKKILRSSWHNEDPNKLNELRKQALDNQQTLALNELLLQLEDVKKQMTKLGTENGALRSQVTSLQIANSRLQRETSQLMSSMKGMMNVQNTLYEENRNQRPPTVTVMTNPGYESRISDLENEIGSNNDILTKEVLEFSCPARTSSLAMEVCDLKSNDAFNEKRIAQILTQLNDITSGGGGIGRDVPIDDMVDIVENGVSDAFCATTRSFTSRNSKIVFEEVMFEKGKMFSLSDGDFQVPKSGFYNFQISYDTDLCGALSLCGPTEVSLRKNSRNEKTMSRNLATDSRRDEDFVSAAFVVDAVRNDKIDLYLADFSGEGLKNVMFCGYYIGS